MGEGVEEEHSEEKSEEHDKHAEDEEHSEEEEKSEGEWEEWEDPTETTTTMTPSSTDTWSGYREHYLSERVLDVRPLHDIFSSESNMGSVLDISFEHNWSNKDIQEHEIEKKKEDEEDEEYCTEYVYLGIRLDNRLSFVPHIGNLIRNCNIRLCTLSKIRKYIDVRTAILIYKAIVMLKLQYGLIFSMNALQQYKQKLQVVQNRALRICCLAGRYVSNYSLHQRHHVLPISLHTKLDLFT